MKGHRCADQLPPFGRSVLIRVEGRPWIGPDLDGIKFRVAARAKLEGHNPNHPERWLWDEFGPGSYAASEVLFWWDLPRDLLMATAGHSQAQTSPHIRMFHSKKGRLRPTRVQPK